MMCTSHGKRAKTLVHDALRSHFLQPASYPNIQANDNLSDSARSIDYLSLE